MSIDALASRRENSVANSLYSDDSIVGGGVPGTFSPFIDAATTRRPSTRATSASVVGAGDLDRDHRRREGLAVALGGAT